MLYGFTIIFFLIVVLTLAVIATFFWAIWKGAPYTGTNVKKVEQVVELVKKMNVKKIADLGSGDGRLLVELAKLGYEVHGFEINPVLVWWSKWRIKKAGLADRTFVHCQNVFTADLSSFDAIFVFVIQGMINKLEPKLKRELKKGAVVISHYFQFARWKERERVGEMWVYEKE